MNTRNRRPRDRKGRGIKLRATLTATAIVALALVLGGVALVTVSYDLTMANLRDTALARANDVVALGQAGRLPSTLATTGKDGSLTQVIGPSGNVVAASANIAGNDPVLAAPPAARTTATETRTDLPVGNTGEPFLVVATPVNLPGGPGWVYVASSIALVDNTVSTVSAVFMAGLPVVLAIVAASTWTAMVRVLRPVEKIREKAAAIGGSRKDGRVPVPATGDEIARLATTMNEMLARLQESAARQSRFIGDASHELRSPLTALRTQVDVALAHPASTEPAQVYRRIQQQAQRMGILIDDLLFLARDDESGRPDAPGTVDLDELVLAEARRLSRPGGPAITVTGPQAARVTGSARDLARLLRNLGDNAVSHAATAVTIGLTTGAGEALLTVADDGPGILPKDRDRIFERFTRLDSARARDCAGTGTGLGLSIARQIALAHGGDIRAGDRPDGGQGTYFAVRIPLLPT